MPPLPGLSQVKDDAPWRYPPASWDGSPAGWAIYWAHQYADPPRGPVDGDWVYRRPLYGNWLIVGFIPDFIEYDLRVTVNINDENLSRDLERLRAYIVSSLRPPFTHIVIDREDALNSPIYYLNESLAGRTHSAFGVLI